MVIDNSPSRKSQSDELRSSILDPQSWIFQRGNAVGCLQNHSAIFTSPLCRFDWRGKPESIYALRDQLRSFFAAWPNENSAGRARVLDTKKGAGVVSLRHRPTV